MTCLAYKRSCNVAGKAKITFQPRYQRSGRPRVRADRVAGAAYRITSVIHNLEKDFNVLHR